MKKDDTSTASNSPDKKKTGRGPQGVDKAPGEDPAGEPGSDNKTALKGKKVDADLTREKDRPAENE